VITRKAHQVVLVTAAVVVTALVVVITGFGSLLPFGVHGSPAAVLLVTAGIVNSILIYWLRRTPQTRVTRNERVSAEFRHEVERYLSDMTGYSPKGRRQEDSDSPEERHVPPDPSAEAIRRIPPGDLIGRITENVEILGGYREDLSALLRLYRLLHDSSLSSEERKRTEAEIQRFEKVIALPFLLEDSASVQEETRDLLENLRAVLRDENGTPAESAEEWTPIDLHDQIEQVIRSLPEGSARSAWFSRHFGDVPLLLSRPNTLFEALYYVLDYFLEVAGSAKAIHLRTAQRGEDVWIGVSVGSGNVSGKDAEGDRRIEAARKLWEEMGGKQTVRDGEIQILLPMHGPASIFSERSHRSTGEKTS